MRGSYSVRVLVAGLSGVMVLAGAIADAGAQAPKAAAKAAARKDAAAGYDPRGSLKIAWAVGPLGYDPHLTRAQIVAPPIMNPVYDRLVFLDSKLELKPMLATSWSFAKDGQSLEFKLRKGVKFSDGVPFNAGAVKANIDRARTHEKSSLKAQLSAITSVDVVDDGTVRFNLAPGKGMTLVSEMAYVAGMMASPAALDKPDLNSNPVGTGPYVLQPGSFKPAESATYVRSPNPYWGGQEAQKLASFQLIGINREQTAVNALRAGQIDVAVISTQSLPEVKEMSAGGKFKYAAYRQPRVYVAYLNQGKNPALKLQRVRQAISTAIDRDAIGEAIFNGACRPHYQPLVEGTRGFDRQLQGTYKYDKEKARRLLKEAGVQNLTFEAINVAGGQAEALNKAIQAQLADIGVTMRLVNTTSSEAIAAFAQGKAEMYIQIGQPYWDPERVLNTYVEDAIYLPGGTTGIVRKAAAGLVDPGKSALEHERILKATNRAVVEEAMAAFICQATNVVAARADVVGLDNIPYAAINVYDVRFLGVRR